MQRLAVLGGAANDTDGVSAAPAVAAVSCKGSLPDAGQAGLLYAADDPGSDEAPPPDSVQEVLEQSSDLQWGELLDS